MTKLVFAFLMFVAFTSARGEDAPKRSTIPNFTLSPDHRYGVSVPILPEVIPENGDLDNEGDNLVDARDGRVLAEIQGGTTGWNREVGFTEVLPCRWSPDGSLLLWEVDGKWSPGALVLLKINRGKVKWQTDILKTAQQATLARTRKAAPDKYEAAKKENAGDGSAFPDGFAIDVEAIDPVSLPLHVRTYLSSDCKVGPYSSRVLTSHLEGVIDAKGKFIVTSFHLGPGHSRHFGSIKKINPSAAFCRSSGLR